jgi:hypothetical protein
MVDDEGWTFEAWRKCPVCGGRSAIQGQTNYSAFGSPPCPCERARPGVRAQDGSPLAPS